MTTIYTVLEIAALLGVILIPLNGPKKKKKITNVNELSNISVNEAGCLEYIIDHDKDHEPVL